MHQSNMRISLSQALSGIRGRLTREDAAAFLGFSSKTLAEWQGKGLGPKSHKLGGRRFYYVADLESFLHQEASR
ncbi:AlpA family transcriptional regulator [Sphingobium sp. 15-1]|uniref:helix-turn-helix transcriptional regulator n=1 Tax=Sphingobium sp. 15-1 TaxID=2729616 RepID=UPI002101380E|nr:helix-turn-helix domain-containing protein [Sphingobium sp. 15-1]